MNLYTEAKKLANEALIETNWDLDAAMDFAFQSCDSHEIAIYYYKAITFCAEQNTDDGEQWLEDCGGIAQPGDSFGAIACRIAFATLLVAVQEQIAEQHDEYDG